LDGEELASLVGHGDRVYDLSFSPDGKILVSGSWDFTALLQSAKQENRKVTYATQFRLSKRRKCYSQFFYERARPHFHDALKIQDKETVFPILRLGYIDLTLIKFQHIISSFFFQNSF
jgi:WD40 repeat protein